MPPLEAKLPGRGLRTLGLVVPGIRQVIGQIGPYTRHWSEQNQVALGAGGPLLAVVGDSTALGIGASGPERGYIGLVGQALAERDGTPWRTINLAQSGARVADGLDRQLPIVLELIRATGTEPDLTVCCIGTNDVVWSADTGGVRSRLRDLIGQLPDPERSVVCPVAGGSPRARVVNRAIRTAAAEAGAALVDPWREPGPPPGERLAADRFHPNDLGYALMARPFARHLGAPEPEVAQTSDQGGLSSRP